MKIGVVGSGAVGVAVCQHIINRGTCTHLVLHGRSRAKAEGEILDFSHAHALNFAKNVQLIGTDDYADLANSDIVVITAGAQISSGNTSRLDLAEVNSRITTEIAQKVEQVAPGAILIVVTNPCDVCAYFMLKNTTYHPRQVISAGCLVDTARFMKIVSERTMVDPKNVAGYILGEHGSHCFLPWEMVDVAGQQIDTYCDQNGIKRFQPESLLDEVRRAGFEVFDRKQNTTHGISASVYRIIEAIQLNEHSVLPVGSLAQGEFGIEDVVLSLPATVNRNGIERILKYDFSEKNHSKLEAVASALKTLIRDVGEKTGLKT